jgi:hypothetical protein
MHGTLDQAAALMKPYAGEIEAWEVGCGGRQGKEQSVGADGARGTFFAVVSGPDFTQARVGR